MSKMPPIPKEQRSFRSEKADAADLKMDARDNENLGQKGRQANIRQNLTPQRSVQDR